MRHINTPLSSQTYRLWEINLDESTPVDNFIMEMVRPDDGTQVQMERESVINGSNSYQVDIVIAIKLI